MRAQQHHITGAGSLSGHETTTDGRFRFISIENPGAPKNRAARQLARSHAVKQGIAKKREAERESRTNFRVITAEDQLNRHDARETHRGTVAMPLSSISVGALDPFQTLAVDSSRLQMLLCDHSVQQAIEPVFSVQKEFAFQSFRSVFRTGFQDATLLCAMMTILAFTAAGGSVNRECLGYRGRTISYVRERMSSPAEATSEPTVGAILLLAGFEARLGMRFQVQLHLGAIRHLLDLRQDKGARLTAGIKRAIFWQDLHLSVLSGSKRIVDHTTFSDLHWTRDAFPPSIFRLPFGFQTRSHLFAPEFIEAIEDLHALQCLREGDLEKIPTMKRIGNHTAWIQSRLVSLQDLSPAITCCRSAVHLCAVMMCCIPWAAAIIPSHISSRLLRELQQANDDSTWDDHPDLLLWVLYIGGSFAPKGPVRSDYVALIRLYNASRFEGMYSSLPELFIIMRQFIWTSRGFGIGVEDLWTEVMIDSTSRRHPIPIEDSQQHGQEK